MSLLGGFNGIFPRINFSAKYILFSSSVSTPTSVYTLSSIAEVVTTVAPNGDLPNGLDDTVTVLDP